MDIEGVIGAADNDLQEVAVGVTSDEMDANEPSPGLDLGGDDDELGSEPVFALLAGAPRRRRPWYRPRWKPLLLRLHRWASLGSLVLILAFFISGCFQLYARDMARWAHPSWYHSTESAHRITAEEAVKIVQAQAPTQFAFDVSVDNGVYRVSQLDAAGTDVREFFVDPGTGRVNASATQQETKMAAGSVGSFFMNLHDCALSCEGMTGYVPFMAGKMPVTGWLWKSFVMIAASLAVIFVAITGLAMWWPGLRKWKRGFRLRRKSLFVFNVDLHRVLGFFAIPFLLMWSVTAITIVLPESTGNLWRSVTSSTDQVTQIQTDAAAAFGKPSRKKPIGLEEAKRIALTAAPGTSFVYVAMPDPDGKYWGQPAYFYWFNLIRHPIDPAKYSGTGSVYVAVGMYDGRTFGPQTGAAGQIWNDYRLGLHFGIIANPWWRLVFLFFGLTPLILSFTGIVMWWRRRKNRRLRKGMISGGETAADSAVGSITGHDPMTASSTYS